MANSPTDYNSEIMEKTTGARVLITDPASDKYLDRARFEAKDNQWHKDLRWQPSLDAED